MNSKLKEILSRPIGGVIFNKIIGILKKALRLLAAMLVLTSSGIIIYAAYTYLVEPNDSTPAEELTATDTASQEGYAEDCNVVGSILHGEVVTYISPENLGSDGSLTADQTASEHVAYDIHRAEIDPKIKAVILEIDSYGGSPVGGEEISNALKDTEKPTVAFIRSAGASAAYMAASGADTIFASKYSDIGGIGVSSSYLDNAKRNQKDGFTYNQLSVGKFKDMGDPDKPLTAEERNLLMRDTTIVYQNFIKTVAENRKLDIRKVEKLADGSTMLGQMALTNGLIDKIGGESEVKEYLKGIIGEDISICW